MQDDLAVLFSRQKIVEYEAKNSIQHLEDGNASNLAQFPSSAAHSIPQHYIQSGSQPLQCNISRDTDCHKSQSAPQPVAVDLDMSDIHHYENIECDTKEAEPYMVSGYASAFAEKKSSGTVHPGSRLPDEPTTGLPYKLSSDPIYNGRRWWENGGNEPIEHQYGAFELMNQF
ncbi:hypothetical protein VTN77DRAFT_5271 [Rasamsonia byssochlamydoides]|uniref:uncharacterized protein n=1 Tax=Rasamsonia byssochlamydoides TaxID=89139 RepID=UPI0037430D49